MARTRLEDYMECAKKCAAVDYKSSASVRANNRAVARMYKLVEAAVADQTEHELFPLLDEELTARWLAHQLLERASPPPEVEARCLAIIEALAEGDEPNALGERIWLQDYCQNRR